MASEIICVRSDQPDDPRYAACYAGGSVFKPEDGGRFHRVEKGSRAVVSRALCVVQYYGNRCTTCPNSDAVLSWKPGHG